ncbi:PIG-L family deacetylase [Maribacter luteus]|uniref:LmbE family protein n=1 Tax=Maribacter luteus TaxID=2594478 RepID=A0A6I2MRK3_9FLAO|nr:PIG-L family deacetylase [Maribacter luteus]MRX63886.1 LmbE family protein [Maribacter luteus]
MRNYLASFIGILLFINTSYSQVPTKNSSSDIYHAIQKLNFLGSALYIAAHPDDENTRLISYLSNEVKARTAYLSLTRGDGGQNLIGPELRELLGVLRTQELLAARRVDGGQQFFSRAVDFGYSKHPNETLKIWNKDSVLSDVVRMIRKFKPDVIINRFDHRSPGTTHGHHTSSAMLSFEAFDLASDPTSYPNQLNDLKTWQPKRLFFNTSWWFYGSEEKFKAADKSNMLSFDIGVYYPMLGVSNNEIASLASSQHRCQGFGRLMTRGTQNEYIELLKGNMPADKNNVFDGIDTTWSRVEGGEAIGAILYEIEKNYNFKNPSAHIKELIKAYQLLQEIPDTYWKEIKSEELKDIITTISGLYLEASSKDAMAIPGSTAEINIEVVNRSSSDIKLKSVVISDLVSADKDINLTDNDKQEFKVQLNIPDDISYTSPYWLNKKGTLGMYTVEDPDLIGNPETPPAFHAVFNLEIEGYPIAIDKPVIHRYSKPDHGELYHPFDILPVATASFQDKVMIFADGKPKKVPVSIKAHRDNIKGEIELCYSKGWIVDKESKPFEIKNKGDEQIVFFELTPPESEDESFISPIIKVDGKELSKELVTIAYDHIPTQSVLLPTEAKVVRLNIKKVGEHIGYIVGAGDDVPKSLEQIGYQVHTIDPNSINAETLSKYGAIVVGIRAYNVVPELKFKQKYLFDYVKKGGNLILQYNTAGRWDKQYEDIAPFPLKLSRERVTNEDSEVEIIGKDHELVNYPNKITNDDFKGWVQERGLYFPSEWDSKFTPILSMHDEGETAKEGSLLIAPYGKGNYIYTGLSFFRELPAGVPGAYKLFANMLSIGKSDVKQKTPIKG